MFVPVFFAFTATRVPEFKAESLQPLEPIAIPSHALKLSLEQLGPYRLNLSDQGVLIETLDGSFQAADHNSEVLFNPASVTKVITSYFALAKLSPEFRFRTRAAYEGEWNRQAGTIVGNLVLLSDGDPLFRIGDGRAFAARLRNLGLQKVEGDLVVRGPFSVNGAYSRETSARHLREILVNAGVGIEGKLRIEDPLQTSAEFISKSRLPWIAEHQSVQLGDILWHTNAFSVNVIADRLGESLGGPEAMKQFLRDELEIPSEDMYFTSNSGLDDNGITPSATVRILRSLYQWLRTHDMVVSDVLPVAGVDDGTLCQRFLKPEFRGAVIGKTGTQNSWENGISALAGVVFTKAGSFFYVIYNSVGDIRFYRDWQDALLERFIEEMGGGVPATLERKEAIDVYYDSRFQVNDSGPSQDSSRSVHAGS